MEQEPSLDEQRILQLIADSAGGSILVTFFDEKMLRRYYSLIDKGLVTTQGYAANNDQARLFLTEKGSKFVDQQCRNGCYHPRIPARTRP